MTAVTAACSHQTAPESSIILGGGKFQTEGSSDINYVLSIIDVTRQQRHLSTMSFLPHGIHSNATDLNRLAIFEKKGPNACEYDLASRSIVREIPRVNNRYFYGHGAYSVDGASLFSTETRLDSFDGVIGIRNSTDLGYLGEFPSYGKEPHECKLIDNGNTLVVTNGGGDNSGEAPSVTYIDVNTQQLVEKVELTNTKLNTGHMAISSKGDLVVISAPRLGLDSKQLGGVSIRPHGGEVVSVKDPEVVTRRMRGEALSVAIHNQKGLAAVTHPDGGMVTFWSIPERRLLKAIDLPHPRGVELTSDQNDFLVSYDKQARLVKIAVNTLEPDPASIIDSSYITGSHIYNWSRNMTEISYPR